MKVIETVLPGVLVIEPKVHGDHRGFFVETWHRDRYAEHGIDLPFVQDNHSRSGAGILRGLHLQLPPRSQGKLVRVVAGAIFDVAVDVRPGSPTLRRWFGTELTADNHRQLWVPPGYAHGFCVLSEVAEVEYKCTELYAPELELSIRWDDPALGVEWPINAPILSNKDAAAPTLQEAWGRLPPYSPEPS